MGHLSDLNFDALIHSRERLDYLIRPRINALLDKSMQSPLVIVCAGAGYGKTCAMSDFLHDRGIPTAWMQISDRDNISSRFWENFCHAIGQLDESTVKEYDKLGFPDTEDKLNQYIQLRNQAIPNREVVLVYDDIHLITDPVINRFLEKTIHYMPKNVTTFFLGHEFPQFNIMNMQNKDLVTTITEEDLSFTQSELAQYLHQQKVASKAQSMGEIFRDTKGWAFSVNLVARSLKKAPGYEGYVQTAMKQNIFRLMELEVWDVISDRLRHFLVRLALIDHLSADLVASLTWGDDSLLDELRRQNAYIRFDSNINAFLFHHLFLDFLHTKQDILTEEEKRKTYTRAADWCNKNNFKVDALGYYEHINDYESITAIFNNLPAQIPPDIARYALGIFERAPADIIYTVVLFAARHVRILMSLGRWEDAMQTAGRYEQKFLRFSGDDTLKHHTLGGLYYCLGSMRLFMGIVEDRYDFDIYYAKMDECLSKFPMTANQMVNFIMGPWANMVGSARAGAQQEYIDTLTRSVAHISHCLHGRATGLDDLCQGELKFYQGNIQTAELFIVRALERAREFEQFDIVHRALFYTLRIAVLQGDYTKAEQALHEMEDSLSVESNLSRFIVYDIALGWYYYLVRQPEMIPGWLKEKFAPYGNAIFIENFGNQVKARYCYITKNYSLLLSYIEELKLRESVLFGRVEMLAIEACVYFQLKDKALAFAALKEAYEAALPSGIVMPFIELGKDMRTLTASALHDPGCGIPQPWLETINRKTATYAKHQSLLVSNYKRANGISNKITLSSREKRVLQDLYDGLSRSEIATNQDLSVNTINSIVNNIYEKLNANNIIDVVRIIGEHKLL